MDDSDNLYNTFLNQDNEFDPVTSTMGLMYGHLNIDEMSQYYDINQYNNSIPLHNEDIVSIVHFNIRSLVKNGNELTVLLHSLVKQPDVIVISESFLDSDSMSDFQLNNYIAFHVTRDNSKRGGVSIFVKQLHSADLIEEFSYIHKEIEICTISLKLPKKTLPLQEFIAQDTNIII